MAAANRPIVPKLLEYSMVILISLIVLLILVQVVSRYLIQLPFVGLEELARLLFVWACFMGTSLGVIRSRHISIDVLLRSVPDKYKIILQFISSLIILVIGLVMVIYGTQFVISKWQYPDYSTALYYPRSLFYAPVPISGLIIFCYTAKFSIERFRK
jgi:TRAP-type C4-dicarboxylate transport system permease small subunit